MVALRRDCLWAERLWRLREDEIKLAGVERVKSVELVTLVRVTVTEVAPPGSPPAEGMTKLAGSANGSSREV